MESATWVKQLESRYPWGALGVAVGMVGTVIGAYGWLHQRKPNVVFEVASEANVLDVHTALPELKILFRNQDIQKTSLNLRILHLRVANTGEADITQGLYDGGQPWGFRITSGRAIEVRLADATSTYLRSSEQPRLADDSTIELTKVILERGSAFTVELLVLHPINQPPEVLPIGKVAGVERMEVLRRDPAQRPSFWVSLLAGSVWIHLARFAGYIVGLVIGAVIIGFVGSRTSDAFARRKRRLRREQLLTIFERHHVAESPGRDAVVDLYAFGGRSGLLAARWLTGISSKSLSALIRRSEAFPSVSHTDWREAVSSPGTEVEVLMGSPHGNPATMRFFRRRRFRDAVLQMLLSQPLLTREGDEAHIAPDFASALRVALQELHLVRAAAPVGERPA